MAVINFTSITNEADLLDQIHDELVDNQGWTSRRNTGSITTNDWELWIEKSADDTVSGRRILFGAEVITPATPSINSVSFNFRMAKGDTEWLDDENAGADGDNLFDDIGDSPTPNSVSLAFYSTQINQAWLIVPDETDSGLQYFYCVIQAGLLYYFCLGAGEMDKAYDFTGGEFFSCSSRRSNSINPNQYSTFLAGSTSGSSSPFCGYIYCDNGAGDVWRDIGGNSAGDSFCPFNYRGIVEINTDLNPSTDSGQFVPFPIIHFCGISDESLFANETLEYIGSMPNAYLTSIRNLDAGETIVLNGDRYLIVPTIAKEGAPDSDSAYSGLLIRTEEDS